MPCQAGRIRGHAESGTMQGALCWLYPLAKRVASVEPCGRAAVGTCTDQAGVQHQSAWWCAKPTKSCAWFRPAWRCRGSGHGTAGVQVRVLPCRFLTFAWISSTVASNFSLSALSTLGTGMGSPLTCRRGGGRQTRGV